MRTIRIKILRVIRSGVSVYFVRHLRGADSRPPCVLRSGTELSEHVKVVRLRIGNHTRELLASETLRMILSDWLNSGPARLVEHDREGVLGRFWLACVKRDKLGLHDHESVLGFSGLVCCNGNTP